MGKPARNDVRLGEPRLSEPRLGELRLLGVVRRRRSALLVSTALQATTLMVLALPAVAQPAPNAQPTRGSVVAGTASITQSASTTAINQASQRAAVNWQSFDVGSQQRVVFNQPSSTAMTLNRVTGPNPSQIAGRIDANGQVVLVNQSGVTFYKGAQVNTNGLIVSAIGISNGNFMKGLMKFDQPGSPNAKVDNQGTITVKQAGLAALVAPQVANSGVINARLGHVILAGAKTATLDLYGDGLLSLDVTNQVTQAPIGRDGKAATALVTNTGVIVADGGTVQLTARAADGIVQALVQAGGKIRVASVGEQVGTIALNGIGGSIVVEGQLSAPGHAPGTMGGNIEVAGTGNVVVAPTARINASGKAGGGTVAIGTTLARARGGPGVTPAVTAANTVVAAGAKIRADATASGNGGRVTVLAVGGTAMAGTITAKGGRTGGDGGFVEVSGSFLSLTGSTDESALAGKVGQLLLDPTNLDIVANTTQSNIDGEFIGKMLPSTATDGAPPPSTITAGKLATLGTNGDVVIQATGILDVKTSVTVANGLALQAGSDLIVDPFVSITTGLGKQLYLGAGFDFAGHTVADTGTIQIGDFAELSAGNLILQSGNLPSGTIGISLGKSTLKVADTLDISTLQGGLSQAALGKIIGFPKLRSSLGINGDVSLLGADNALGTLGVITVTNGSFQLINNGHSLNVTGPLSAGNITLKSPGISVDGTVTATGILTFAAGGSGIALNANHVVTGDTVVLSTAGGGVIQQPVGSLTATTVLESQGGIIGGVTLTNSGNKIAAVGTLAVDGDIAIKNSVPMLVTGPIATVTGNVYLQTSHQDGVTFDKNGSIQSKAGGRVSLQTDQLTTKSSGVVNAGAAGTFELAPNALPGTKVALGSGAVAGLTLTDLTGITAGTVRIGAVTQPASLGGVLDTTAAAISVDGNFGKSGIRLELDSISNGAINEAVGAVLTADTLTGTAGSVLLGSFSNAIGTLGAFNTAAGFVLTNSNTAPLVVTGPVSADQVSLQAPRITILGAITGTSSVSLTATASGIDEGTPATGVITTKLLLGSSAGGVSLIGAANAIDSLGKFDVSGSSTGFALTDGVDLAVVGKVTATGNVFLKEAPGKTLSFVNGGSVSAGDIALVTDGLSVAASGVAIDAAGTVEIAPSSGGVVVSLGAGSSGLVIDTGDLAAITAGELRIGGYHDVTNGGKGTISAGSIDIAGPVSLTAVLRLRLDANGPVTESVGPLNVGTVVGVADSYNLINSGNAIGTLGAPGTSLTATTGTIAVENDASLTIAGVVQGTTGVTLVADTGDITNIGTVNAVTNGVSLTATTGNIVNNGTVSAGNDALLSAGNDIDNNMNALITAAGAGSLLAPSVALVTQKGTIGEAIGGVISATNATTGGVVSLNAKGNVTFDGTIAASMNAGVVSLVSGGAITETSTGILQAATLIGSAGTGATLNSTSATGNLVANLGSFTAGSFVLFDAQSLMVIAPVIANTGSVVITDTHIGGTAGSSLTNNSTIQGPTGVTLVADVDIINNGTVRAVTNDASLLAGHDIDNNANALITAGHFASLNAAHAINDAAGAVITAAGVGSSATPSVTLLAQSGTIAEAVGGIISATNATTGVVSLNAKGDVTFGGTIAAGGTAGVVSLVSGGTITETAASGILQAATLIGSAGNDVTLNGASATGNLVGNLGSFTTGTVGAGSFVLSDAQSLTVIGPVSAGSPGKSGSISLDVTGPLTLSGDMTALIGAASAPGISLTTHGATGTINQTAGTLATDGSFIVTASGDVTQDGGVMTSGGALAISTATNFIQNNGVISSFGAIDLSAVNFTQTGGFIGAYGALGVTAGGNFLQSGGILAAKASGNSVTISAGADASQTGGAAIYGNVVVVDANVSGGATGTGNTVDTIFGTPTYALPPPNGPEPVLPPATLFPGAIGLAGGGGGTPPPAGDITRRGYNITIGKAIAAGTVTLDATHDITETATGSITAGLLTGSAGIYKGPLLGNVVLDQSNFVTNLGNFSSTKDFIFRNNQNLTVTGAVSAGQGPVGTPDGTPPVGAGVANAIITTLGSLTIAGSVLSGHAAGGGNTYAGGNVSLVQTNGGGPTGDLQIPGTVTAIPGVSGGGTLTLTAAENISETGTLIAGLLTGSAVGSASFTGATSTTNQVATLGSFNAADFTLYDGISLTVMGGLNGGPSAKVLDSGVLTVDLDASVFASAITLTATSILIPGVVTDGGSGTVNLIANKGGISETGVLVVGTLSGSATGAANLSGASPAANQIANVGNFAAAGFTLNDGVDLNVAGSVAGGPSAAIVDLGALNVTGTVAAAAVSLTANSIGIPGVVTDGGAGTVGLFANLGDIIEPGTIVAGTLTGHAAGVALLTSASGTANQIGVLGPFAALALALNDGVPLLVNGPVVGARGVTLADSGGLTVAGSIVAPSVVLSGSEIAIPGMVSASQLALGAFGGGITETGTLIAGTLVVVATGAASFTGSNTLATLSNFSAAGFTLNDIAPLLVDGVVNGGPSIAITDAAALTIPGRITATSVALSGTSITIPGTVTGTATTNLLATTGTIAESGALITGTLSGSAAGAATFLGSTPTSNRIGALGNFNSSKFAMNDGSDLTIGGTVNGGPAANVNVAGVLNVTGALTAGTVGINASRGIAIPGSVAGATSVNLITGGSIDETGALTAGLLTGSAAGNASLTGSNAVTLLGNFTAGSVFTLNDLVALTIDGPLTAPKITVNDSGNLLVLADGATVTTGGNTRPATGNFPAALAPANGAPGAFFQAGNFEQLGTSKATGIAGGPSTLQITSAGNIQFGNLQAPGTWLILNVNTGQITGNVFVGTLDVSFTAPGGSQLEGTIGNLSGPGAASAGNIQRQPNSNFRFNSCPIHSVNCVLLPSQGIPTANPLNDINIGTLFNPDDQDDLLLPIVSDEDY